MAQYIRQQDQEEVERPGSPTSEVLLIILLMFTFPFDHPHGHLKTFFVAFMIPLNLSPQGKHLNSKPIFKFP